MEMILWVVLLAVARAADLQEDGDLVQKEFEAFKLQHNKRYASEAEEQTRLRNFLNNKQEVAAHNARYAQGLVGYRLGINEYSDMTHDEFLTTRIGYRDDDPVPKPMLDVTPVTFIPPEHIEVHDEVDWREEGAVTPVKNQGECKSSWAFSATGSLEGQHFRKTGELISMSEQNLIDCSNMYGNKGCEGGSMDKAYQYVKDNGGIVSEEYYPYNPHESYCIYYYNESVADVAGFVEIPEGDEEMLKLAVATVGPVSVRLDASLKSFLNYDEGIYFEEKCKKSTKELKHSMLVVGYGTEEKEGDFWLIKNSWGTSWGMDGYIKIARNRNNTCGVATAPIYPLTSLLGK